MHIESGGGKGKSQDFELNLASIIDCLTVLLTFLLASSSFIAIGILDTAISAGSPPPAEQKQTPPPVNFTVNLQKTFQIEIKVAGKKEQTIKVDALGEGKWNFDKLVEELKSLKAQWSTKEQPIDGLTIVAEDAIIYKDIIANMEKITKIFPAVLLGGF